MFDREKKPRDLLDVLSFVLPFLAIGLLFYIGFYRTAEQNNRHFKRLTQKAEHELKMLSDAQSKKEQTSGVIQRADPNQPVSISPDGSISDVSMFLQKINNETKTSGIELSDIKKLDRVTYKLTAFAPFYQFLRFLFKIEQSNLAVEEMEILASTPPKNLIHMTLKVIDDQMSKNNVRTLDEFASQYTEPFKNLSGRNDPFKSFIAAMEEVEKNKRRKPKSYLETLDLSQLQLIGIIVGPSGNWAMVKEAKGKGYVIKKGTAIGTEGGVVFKITDKEVIIREEYKDFKGQIRYKDITKKVFPLQ